MTGFKEVAGSKRLMGRLERGGDLLEELTAVCVENGVKLGMVHAIGALDKARVGYYEQGRRQYKYLEFNRQMELVGLQGNVSLRDEKPMVHAHVTLSDDEGRAYGGHLAPGTVIFICEFCIDVFDGPEFRREPDDETTLPLWKM